MRIYFLVIWSLTWLQTRSRRTQSLWCHFFSIVDVMTLIAKFVFPQVWAEYIAYCSLVLFLWKWTSVDSLSRWDFVVRLSVAQSAEDWPQSTIIGSTYMSLWAFASYLLFSFINLLYSHSHSCAKCIQSLITNIFCARLSRIAFVYCRVTLRNLHVM